MRRILASCLLLAITLPCHAQGDKAKPNTLTRKEIADGWILLFDGETTFGWRSVFDEETVSDGWLVVEPKKKYRATTQLTTKFPSGMAYAYEAYYSGASTINTPGIAFRVAAPSSETRIQQSLEKTPKHHKGVLNREDGLSISTTVYVPPGDKLFVRNLKMRPLEMKPLFNGKDLAGWKEFPGKKSKFAVVDGAINVKDGPGDLQTIGKYKDFVLQLECISNGKHLNSGIFFRCRDKEYQNGYEAQIHNGFLEMPKKYMIEEYDPKTNKLIGKKEQLFNAIDYGTGAIYRRMPARKQMAKDDEWFTMTVVAHGNHLATWVNGVQVTDWYDNRKKSDNARTGCKLEAGHISIQGHDPTTNLSFRNFRIAELK